jgi:hypothetical protein
MFAALTGCYLVLRLVNGVLEKSVIPARRIKRAQSGKKVLREVTIPKMCLTEEEIVAVQKSDIWPVMLRGQHTDRLNEMVERRYA